MDKKLARSLCAMLMLRVPADVIVVTIGIALLVSFR
jgi:hypothetical protein